MTGRENWRVGIAAIALFIPAVAQAATYSTTVMADNPVLYYHLNESSGTTALDSATGDGAQHGTYLGAFSLNQPGVVAGDSAVRFNPLNTNSSGHIDSTFVLTPTSAFTVEFWLNLPTLNDGNTEETVLAQRNGTGTGRSLVYWSDADQRMVSNLGASGATDFWASSGGVTAGNYFYVAFVYDGAGNVTWYKNGAANGTITGIAPEAANGGIFIGDDKFLDGTISALNGTLDEFAIYNTALSGSQIATHFAAAPEPSSILLAVMGSVLLWRRRCDA
jgi:hypothetical protein